MAIRIISRAIIAKAVQSIGEFGAEQAEVALDPAGTADHHMVGARTALRRHDLSGKGAEAALHAVADDRAADFLGDGEAHAHRRVRILAVTDEQDEAGRGQAPAAVRGNEVGALAKCG